MLILSRRKKKITIRMADDVSRQTKLDDEALQEKCGKRMEEWIERIHSICLWSACFELW